MENREKKSSAYSDYLNHSMRSEEKQRSFLNKFFQLNPILIESIIYSIIRKSVSNSTDYM